MALLSICERGWGTGGEVPRFLPCLLPALGKATFDLPWEPLGTHSAICLSSPLRGTLALTLRLCFYLSPSLCPVTQVLDQESEKACSDVWFVFVVQTLSLTEHKEQFVC